MSLKIMSQVSMRLFMFYASFPVCAIFTNKVRHPQRHKLAREPANLSGSHVEFQEKGNRFSTLFECSLNFQSALYLDRQCMHCGRMNQCYR